MLFQRGREFLHKVFIMISSSSSQPPTEDAKANFNNIDHMLNRVVRLKLQMHDLTKECPIFFFDGQEEVLPKELKALGPGVIGIILSYFQD